MKKLYFVRHGETEFNRGRKFSGHTNVELTDRGHKQAQKTGSDIRNKELSIDVIVTSPLIRARQTAEHIAAATGYPHKNIVVLDILVERNFGVFEGNNDLRTLTRYALDESAIDEHEGVETLQDLQHRAEITLKNLHELPHDTILVVGHGSHGRALRRAINKEPIHSRGRAFDNAELVEFL